MAEYFYLHSKKCAVERCAIVAGYLLREGIQIIQNGYLCWV